MELRFKHLTLCTKQLRVCGSAVLRDGIMKFYTNYLFIHMLVVSITYGCCETL